MAKTSSARRTQSRRAAVPILPDDIVLWEILIRLPATALLRCRTVQSRTADAFDLRKSPAEHRPVLRFNDYYRGGNFEVCTSCDGLLLLYLSNGRFSICNPITRQWTELPTSLTCVKVVGMYMHSSSGEYRVLYWKGMDGRPYQGGSVVYYVLTIGSSAEAMCIERFNMVGLTYMGNRPSVLLRSCLHWGRWTVENQLIVFDTVAESFSHLDAMESVVDLWVLQDYELEVWLLKYRIELPQVQLRSIAKANHWHCYFHGLVVSDNGDVLVHFESNLHLFHYDCKGNLVHKFPLDRAISWPLGYWFKESLVRHTFFQRN
ncbi:hypothetical protein EJB05_24360, partial [Eragrostis curvula]